MEEPRDEDDKDVDMNYFAVDVHARCVKIVPGGFDENEFTLLEVISRKFSY